MSAQLEDILRYWRASLADGALGKGQFRQSDRSRYLDLPKEALKTGVLPPKLTEKVFEGQPEKIGEVSIRFWPLVTARKTSHAAETHGRLPDIVAPVVTEAEVWRDGTIHPTRNAIARDLLSPLPAGEFSIGTVDALDEFLTVTPLAPERGREFWASYLGHCRKMVDAVTDGWPGDAPYIPTGTGRMEVTDGSPSAIRQILGLYDSLLEEAPDVPLLRQIAQPDPSKSAGRRDAEFDFSRRLGHSNDQFPLADQQREVLAHLAASRAGDVLAVNGPPGTGKTTLLLSAIAGEWIRAALEGGMPRLIVAASSNNQAVTNIIDAFGKDFATGTGPFAGRWLPDISSFGLFLAAFSREAQAARTYQTEKFFNEIETVDYVLRARESYLGAARAAFPELVAPDAAGIVAALHDRIKAEVERLSRLDAARRNVEATRTAVAEKLGPDPKAHAAGLSERLAQCSSDLDLRETRVVAVKRYQADESGLLALFGFLPAIARKRILRARLAVEIAGGEIDMSDCKTPAALEARLGSEAREARDAKAGAAREVEEAQRLRSALRTAETDWHNAVSALGAPPTTVDEADELDRFLDCETRFTLFLLATHYWEGRWLLAMEEDLPGITSSQKKTGRKSVIPRWQRRMMLTPCAVATFATLPGRMTYASFSAGEFDKQYLLDFVDLLIVDEAGQVLPEVAGACFALAKRALVIGDTQQIAPISSVPRPVDIGNLRECALLPAGFCEENLKAVSDRGLRSVDGSAMRLAQEAFGARPYAELEKGLYLFEHRRCYDEIVSYCNALCYKGALQPKRGKAPKDATLPPIGYLHIDGMAVRRGSSRSNPVEAQTIAAWLAANRADLESRYGQKLEKIVGIVTPFGRQVGEIAKACAAQGIRVSERDAMTIGTVHSLQGAERPLVLFSPVYSKHADGGFIDMSPSMLNVTVSRAKDSFLVFGDMDVFSTAAKGSPRAVLGDFLFAAEDNRLEFEIEPRRDLVATSGQVTTLRDAAQHDAFLLDALASGASHFRIVSPWVIVSTMERAGLLDAFCSAIARGAKIEVYADPKLNQGQTSAGLSNIDAAEKALSEIGVELHKVRQIHSKIVVVDDNLLCVGSYNWLSANRQGKFARHEMSLVYRGTQLAEEIDVATDSLKTREIR